MTQSETSSSIRLPGGTYKGCLFDMDGVLTDTASVHAAAWKRAFDDFLRACNGDDFKPFDISSDYPKYVDGKPRNDGVRSFFTSRDIALPEGTPDDAPGDDTIWAVGNKKNDNLNSVLEQQGVDVYDGSVRFVKAALTANMSTGVVSSSANTKAILQRANMTNLFEVRVDGVEIITRKLKGKPAPDSFLEAARELGLDPADVVVFEDALAGVAAGRSGHFGLVVGVDRVGQAKELEQAGADIVVTDLDQLLG